MILKRAIMHVVDREGGNTVFSQAEIDLTEKTIYTYLEKVLKKFLESDLKTGVLSAESEIRELINQNEAFIENSQKVAEMIIDTTATIVEMPNFNLLFLEYSEDEEDFWGMLKYSHKKAFTHIIDYDGEGVAIKLTENKSILPSASQRIEEGLTISLKDFRYELAEKSYLLEGKRVSYLSKLILKEEVVAPSFKENVQVMKRAVKEVAHKFQEEPYESLANLQKALFDCIEEDRMVSNVAIAEELFPDNYEARTTYLDSVESKGFTEDQEIQNVVSYEKKYSKQKIKLDNDIELIIPVELYSDSSAIEFIQQEDGSTSIILKNIQNIKNKF